MGKRGWYSVKEYRGYWIDYNFFGCGDYTVSYFFKLYLFNSITEAERFIDACWDCASNISATVNPSEHKTPICNI